MTDRHRAVLLLVFTHAVVAHTDIIANIRIIFVWIDDIDDERQRSLLYLIEAMSHFLSRVT